MANLKITGKMKIVTKIAESGYVYHQASFGSKDRNGVYHNIHAFVSFSDSAMDAMRANANKNITKEMKKAGFVAQSEIFVTDGWVNWTCKDGRPTFNAYIMEATDDLEGELVPPKRAKATKKTTKTKQKPAFEEYDEEDDDDLPF